MIAFCSVGKADLHGLQGLMFCGRDGYPYHLNIHQGKESASERAPHRERVVTRMVDDGHFMIRRRNYLISMYGPREQFD
ncbi:Uncharacterized protein TSPI_00849 [Trichinella spiralis]|uniref:Uncharacterized protein n=1 Tax=Trichinella spiralis TaxID=6334 RepID=A0ABR3KP46_TRISP